MNSPLSSHLKLPSPNSKITSLDRSRLHKKAKAQWDIENCQGKPSQQKGTL